MKILVKGKVETVSLDRVKPAHLECEPTTGTTIQRKTPNKQHRSKATRISSIGIPKVKLSNRDNNYIAPHSRAPTVSRANGNGSGLRTYSCIPLHLRGKTPGAAEAVIDSTKSNRLNIANRDKISTEKPVRKNGRIIQTPARFVQMVHAIVAPNDIYGGPNRMHRINNVFKL